MRRRTLIVVLAVAIPAVVVTIAAVMIHWALHRLDEHLINSRSGPLHVFQLPSAPKFLTDQEGLARARTALTMDGYDPTAWTPYEDRRSHAPDGTTDVYLSRNTLDPNSGSVLFISRDATNPERIVQLELRGDRVECRVVRPK